LILCEIACEEVDAGNFAGRVWSTQACKNMREKYWERANLWHPGREFRNKMTNLKGLYTDWWYGCKSKLAAVAAQMEK
jgi:hypothetical protein